MVKILADQSYRGTIAVLLQQAFGCTLELTQKLGQGFVVEPWRSCGGAYLGKPGKCAVIVSRLRGTPGTPRKFRLYCDDSIDAASAHTQSTHSRFSYSSLETVS